MSRDDLAFGTVAIVAIGLMIIASLICLVSLGCAAQREQGIFIQPGVPIRLLKPVTAPAASYEVETAKGVWTVGTSPTVLPAGFTGLVLPAEPATTP